MRTILLVTNMAHQPFRCMECREWRTHHVVLAADHAQEGNSVYYLPCGHEGTMLSMSTHLSLTPEELAAALLMATDY